MYHCINKKMGGGGGRERVRTGIISEINIASTHCWTAGKVKMYIQNLFIFSKCHNIVQIKNKMI
jgi:hypothetical protein